MTEKKVLILGGAGFLGMEIARRFEKENRYLITIGDLSEPPDPGIAFEKTDVLNRLALEHQIKQHDIIINCSGQISHPIYGCFRINTEGISHIAQAVKDHKKKLIQISTVAVYGTIPAADENTAMNPESPYSTCKAFAEFIVNRTLGNNACILRLPNLYGENQVKGLFSYLIRSYISDRKLHFNNDGSLCRYFLHIKDCSEALFLTVDKDLTGTYNIPAPEKFDLTEIISRIESIKSMKFEAVFDRNPPIDNIDNISFSDFREVTNFNPERSVHDFINQSFPTHE